MTEYRSPFDETPTAIDMTYSAESQTKKVEKKSLGTYLRNLFSGKDKTAKLVSAPVVADKEETPEQMYRNEMESQY